MLDISIEQVQSAIEQYQGICIVCGSEKDGVEPDADSYLCDECGEYSVHGGESVLFMLMRDEL
jgi:hypothetical protein